MNFGEEVIIEEKSQPSHPETKKIQENISSRKLEKQRRSVYTFRRVSFPNSVEIRVVRFLMMCQDARIPIDHNNIMRRKS